MPRPLALTLCTIFVLFLLRLERKQYPDATFALWIPIIWFLLITSKPLAIWFGIGGESMEEGSPLDRAFLSVLLVIGLLILAKRRFKWAIVVKENAWVILLISYMLISIVWSDMPYTSFKRWIRELTAVVMIFLITTEPDPRQAVQCIFRRLIYILIPYSFLLIKFYQNLGIIYHRISGETMWTGALLHKNSLGVFCFFTIFVLLWSLVRRWRGRNNSVVWYQIYVEAYLLILAIWLFLGPSHSFAYSATSTVALAIGLTALIGILWMKKNNIVIGSNTLTVIIAIIIVFGTITAFAGGLMVSDVAPVLGRSETLTGRTNIWAYLVPYAMQKPILGYGFGGFWTEAHREATSSHAHNGYLDIILNLGFLGYILFSMFLIHCIRKAHKVVIHDFDWGCLWICILLMAVVHNIGESTTVSFAGFLPGVNLFMLNSSTYDNLNNHGVLRGVNDLAAEHYS